MPPCLATSVLVRILRLIISHKYINYDYITSITDKSDDAEKIDYTFTELRKEVKLCFKK
jgi:hypothetical protein